MTTGSMECVVTKVAVTSSRRREGVGRELVSAAIARAKDKRARVVRLRVEIDNAAATTLYEALGFEKETERGILSDFYGAGDAGGAAAAEQIISVNGALWTPGPFAQFACCAVSWIVLLQATVQVVDAVVFVTTQEIHDGK